MKRIYYFLLIISLTVACSHDDDPKPVANEQLTAALLSGSWRITLFQEDGENQTADFAGYSFDFRDAGLVLITNGAASLRGSWQSGTDDSQQKLMLNLGTADPWEELNEDWHVLELSNSIIRLEHESGGDGSLDLLTFER